MKKKKKIHKISFTSDKTMFSFGNEKLFLVCLTKPFVIITKKRNTMKNYISELIDYYNN